MIEGNYRSCTKTRDYCLQLTQLSTSITANNEAEEKKRIMEDYTLWKKTAPVLYDMVITHNLTWPTLTCQWLPKRTQ